MRHSAPTVSAGQPDLGWPKPDEVPATVTNGNGAFRRQNTDEAFCPQRCLLMNGILAGQSPMKHSAPTMLAGHRGIRQQKAKEALCHQHNLSVSNLKFFSVGSTSMCCAPPLHVGHYYGGEGRMDGR